MTDIFQKLKKEGKCPVERGNMIAINGVHKGQMYINTTRLLNVDATDILSLTKAEIEGHLQNEKLIQTLRENVPGFENVYISSIAPNLGVRETRRFEGVYCLKVEEALSGEISKDSICLWNAKVEIKNIVLEDNSTVNPVTYGKKIIAFGDSITQGFIVAHPSLSYVGRITNLGSAEVLNQGVGGFFFDERSLDKKLKDYNPDLIIIGYGTNDASSINSLEEIVNNQQKYLEKLRTIFPQIKVVAFLPIWGNDPRLQARNMVRNFNCQDVNRELAKTYVTYNVQVVRDNFFPKINDFYSSDLVHPNDLGGTLMGDEILQYL